MINFKKSEGKYVSEETMTEIYEKIKTPYKYGAVLKFDEDLCDSPTVYRWKDKWYMSFIKISKNTKTSGYDSHLATSEDLLHWKYVCQTTFRNENNAWDSKQIALYAAYVENDLYGKYRLQQVNGKYHFAYLGGCLDGYETDPLMIGQCKTADICDANQYERFPTPRLNPTDSDARKGETLTLYKSDMFIDEAKTTGYTYVNAYNAKAENHKESIYLAVSKNGEDWERYGNRAIIFDDTPEQSQQINGDPQILKYKDIYIMLYFVLENGRTYDTFACSYDLEHWTKWKGKPLIESEEEWEDLYAHKPCLVVENEVVYHFYCAVNKRGERFIALTTNCRALHNPQF